MFCIIWYTLKECPVSFHILFLFFPPIILYSLFDKNNNLIEKKINSYTIHKLIMNVFQKEKFFIATLNTKFNIPIKKNEMHFRNNPKVGHSRKTHCGSTSSAFFHAASEKFSGSENEKWQAEADTPERVFPGSSISREKQLNFHLLEQCTVEIPFPQVGPTPPGRFVAGKVNAVKENSTRLNARSFLRVRDWIFLN